MTDTTDIAALRRRSNNLRTADQTDAFIDLLLDKIEAERQRAADLVLHVNTQANMREKAEEKYTEVSGWYVKMKTRMLKAEEELAQLVNGQRLAITDDMAMAFHAATTDSALGRDDMEEIKAGLCAVQELFAAPQKPVVLPKSHYVCGCADRFMSAPEVIAAIKAADGIVKDGE